MLGSCWDTLGQIYVGKYFPRKKMGYCFSLPAARQVWEPGWALHWSWSLSLPPHFPSEIWNAAISATSDKYCHLSLPPLPRGWQGAAPGTINESSLGSSRSFRARWWERGHPHHASTTAPAARSSGEEGWVCIAFGFYWENGNKYQELQGRREGSCLPNIRTAAGHAAYAASIPNSGCSRGELVAQVNLTWPGNAQGRAVLGEARSTGAWRSPAWLGRLPPTWD